MQNVYLVQADIVRGIKDKSIYLPYAVGQLAAFAWEDDYVRENYLFKGFIFKCENVDQIITTLDNPGVMGFSNYCWNTEFSKLLAQKVKEIYPECVIIFGGHNVPNNTSFLEKYSYIDVLVHGEGEVVFKDILCALPNNSLSCVNNISFRNCGGETITTAVSPPADMDFPSPYVNGWFDSIIEQYPGYRFNAILETSRGCPHACAYCDWGLLQSKPRLFSIDRVLAEIKWMSDNKIAFIWGADANFGLYDRDLEIVDALAKAKSETGYPEKMRMNYSKSNFENVFKIVKKLKEADFDRIGATLSFQSMSDEVLSAIGRKNMNLDFYKKMQAKYNKENMKTYSELILGLPRETYESFIKGIGKLFELGQHFVFEIYGFNLLPNSLLGQPEQIEKYKLKTVKAEVIRPHNKISELYIPEFYDLVVETDTLSREEWVRATVYYHYAKSLHGFGFLRTFAIYLFYEHSVPYHVFYDRLLDYFETNPELSSSKLYFEIKRHEDEVSRGILNDKLIFEPVDKECMWDDHEYINLNLMYMLDIFYEEVRPYLESYKIESSIFDDFFKYQTNILRVPGEETVVVELNWDIHNYISNIYIDNKIPLLKKRNTLTMRDSDVQIDLSSYSKIVVWYGRMGWKSYKDEIETVYHENTTPMQENAF